MRGKSKEEIAFARGLCRRQTDAERALWNKLRNKQIEGVRFRRQQPIGSYIVDFVSLERKLIIEIDGGQHNQRKELLARCNLPFSILGLKKERLPQSFLLAKTRGGEIAIGRFSR